MAWQLIYTSAPRLLEAGRTGFGTVARHRAVSGMLVSTVERFSQFARLPGHDPRRVVHTYRILTVGSGTYHVFSCLQDAGSDYTGRTNHLAQHVIAEAREIRALSASGLTPADILLAIPWRSTWTEAPRFLDPAEEIDLAGFRPAKTSAWASATGNPAYARLLCTPQALKGCYLIPPPGVNALELFREAMLEAPQAGWQTSFTTTLEPNDEVGDFRWIGLPPGSPMRSQAEVSNRPLLDLTQPAKLPTPPQPPAQLAPVRREPEAATPLPAEPAMPTRSPDKVSLSRPLVQPIPAATMGGWSPESRRKASNKSRKGLLLALVAAAVMVATTAVFLLWRHMVEKQERDAFEERVSQVWKKHGLTLDETRKKIREQRILGDGQALLDALEAYVKAVADVLAKRSSADPTIPTESMPNDFNDLQKAVENWKKSDGRRPAFTGTKVSDLISQFDEWEDSRKKSWKEIARHISKIDPMPDFDQGLRGKCIDAARQMLRKDEPNKLDLSEWKRLNERFGSDETIADWLEIYSGLESDSRVKKAEEIKNNGDLPLWLKAKGQKVLDARDKKTLAEKEADQKARQVEAAKAATAKRAKMEDADSLDAKHSIYIFLLKEVVSAKVPVEADMLVYIGALGDKNTLVEAMPEPKTGELLRLEKHLNSNDSKWLYGKSRAQTDISDLLKFAADGTINGLPNGTKDGLRIVARSKDTTKVLFDLRILPSVGLRSAPVLSSVRRIQMSNSRPGEITGLGELINSLTFVSAATPVLFKLRATTGVQAPFDLALNGGKCQVKLPQPVDQTPILIDRKKNELDSAKKELDKLENVKKDQEKFKNIILLEKTKQNIIQKTSDLERLQRELVDLNKPRELPAPRLPDGEYMLVAFISSGAVQVDICKIQLVADKSKPSPSTK